MFGNIGIEEMYKQVIWQKKNNGGKKRNNNIVLKKADTRLLCTIDWEWVKCIIQIMSSASV